VSGSDGAFVSTTKILDHGPDSDRYNLVLVAEGYQASEMTTFHQDCQDLLDHVFSTAPFDELEIRCAFNVYRLDVSSTESGADDPTDCGGTGDAPATYFDATFCGDGAIQRLLVVDDGAVIDLVDDEVPAHDRIVVIVNSSTYGGSGGGVAVTSTGGDWMNVALHEMGHAVFGLADEYPYYAGCGTGEAGHDTYTGGEFAEVNVSATSDRAAIKWAALVDAGTAMPTTSNADCTDCDTQASPVPAGTVGAFEGAKYFHCGAFRPEFTCMMLDLSAFCAVCRQRIRDVLAPYTQPTTITLSTPSITFNDVPEGTTTVRATTFSVTSCADLSFEIVSGPDVLSGPAGTAFGTPLGTVASSPAAPGAPSPRDAFVWISYTGTSPGDAATGTVTIQSLETGEQWDVPITANTVARPTVAVVLVLDRSASMEWDAGDGRRRIDVLHDSAPPFCDIIPEDDALGVVAFDHDPYELMAVTDAGPLLFGAGRTNAKAAISAHTFNPAGNTAIGDGVEIAHNDLAAVAGYDEKAMIVLTDGQETAAKYIADVADLIDDRVFAIGLGTAEAINPVALTALTNGTGGQLLMTGTLDANDYFRLTKYYLQILAGVTNTDIVHDPDSWIASGQKHVIPFTLAETDIEAKVILLSPAPYAVDFVLETPDGDIIDPASVGGIPGASFVPSSNNAHYVVSLPALVGANPAREGTWNAILSIDDGGFKKYISLLERQAGETKEFSEYRAALAHGVRYSLSVHTFSNLRMQARLAQSGYEPGATLTLRAVLTEYGLPVAGRANVHSDLLRPDGTTAVLSLAEVEPGVFEAATDALLSGIYRFDVAGSGSTLRGRPFTRRQTVTGAVWRGGDGDPPSSVDDPGVRDGRLCDLLECLLEAITPEGEKALRERGLDFSVVRKCFAEWCAESQPPGHITQPGIEAEPVALPRAIPR
jgi:IgA peptidase M64/VWA domain-containing protein